MFIKSGNTYQVSSPEAMDLHDLLPAATYVMKSHPQRGLYLEEVDNFNIPSKIYGNSTNDAQRILTTYLDRPATTGVALVGEKGSGKTLLTKQVSNLARTSEKIPTIIINSPMFGETFNSTMQEITQPCILLFDEFEKVYDKEQQEQVLTLLDGVFASKKLVLLTCNDKWQIDIHMRNRPGRIYYMLDFEGLDMDFVEEYCQDKLNNKSHIADVVKVADTFSQFNFDMLQSLVEEMNRYNETAVQCLRMLNVKPEFGSNSTFTIALKIGSVKYEKDELSNTVWTGNPMREDDIEVAFKIPSTNREFDDDEAECSTSNPGSRNWEWEYANFSSKDMIRMERGFYVFKNDKDQVLELTKQAEKKFNYLGAF